MSERPCYAWAVLVMGLWVTWSYLYSDNVQTHVFLLQVCF